MERIGSLVLGLFLASIPCSAQWQVGQRNFTPAVSASPTFAANCYQIGTSTSYTTSAVNTTGATFIVFAVSGYGTAVNPAITDNKSNGTATALTAYGIAPGVLLSYYATPTVGTGHTFTFTTTIGEYIQACVYVWSGVTGVYDSTDQGAHPATGTTCQPGSSINPGSGTHVVMAIAGDSSNSTTSQTINSGYAMDKTLAGSSGAYISLATAHLIQNPGASTQPTFSSLTAPSGCAIMSFH